MSSKTAFSPRGLPAPPFFILLLHIFKNGIFTERVTGSTPLHPFVLHFKNGIFTEMVTGSTPFHPLASYFQKRHFHREGYRLHPFSSSCFTSSKTAYSPRGLPAPPLFILLFHIFKNGIFTERVTGSTPFHPLVSHLQKRHFHREGYRLHPFSSSCFISSKTAFSPRGLPAPPLFTPFRPLVSYLQKRHFHREGYRLHPFSSSCFISSKTAYSPRGLPAPPLFLLLFHIFKNGIFTEKVTGSTPFHPLASYLQKPHFHQEGYRLHPFSSSCFISSKTAFSPRGLPAPPLFILFFHIFKNGIFTRVTGSTPFHPLVSHLQKRHFHRDGYRLHLISSSCFISSKTAFSPRGLPAPPLFLLLFHIFKNGIFTERVTGFTPFHPLASYLQKRHFHREGYRPHPFSSSCFTSSKTAFSPRGLPAPPLFIVFFHIFKNGIVTERVTGPTPFHPLVSYFQKRHFHREGYRLHPFSSSCFTSSKNGIFTERVTGSTPFRPLVSYLQKRHFHRDGYRLHLISSSCFISSKTAFSPRGLPAPPLFILFFHIFKNGIFTEGVTGSTPFPPLVSHLQKGHFHREGYRLHPFSSSCFISSKTAFSPRGLPAPPLFILLFHIFKNGIFTERVTGSTPFHPLFSNLQKRHFHREGYRLHPFSSCCFTSSKTAFSPKGVPAPPLFILLFHIVKNGIFTERVTGSTPFHPLFHIFKNGSFTERLTGSTPFHPLVSHLQKRHIHREGYRPHPFSSPCFTSSKTAFSSRGLPAPPLFILLFHIFKNGIFTEMVTGSTPFHPLFSFFQKRHFHQEGYRLHPFSSFCFISSKTAFSPRGLPAQPLFLFLFHIFKNGHFHREGYRLHPFSSSCFIFSKTAFSPRGLPAPPLFILLFHIFKNGIFTERVTGSTPFHPLVSHLQKRHFHREGYFSSSCFTSSKTAYSPRGLPAPPLFILLFHIFKNGIFTERVTGSTPFHPVVSHLQKRHFHREGYRLHPFSSSFFISLKTAFSPRGLPAPPLFILLFHIFKNGIFTERVTGSTPFHPLVSYLQKRQYHQEGYRLHPFSSSCFTSSKTAFSPRGLPAPPLFTPFRPLVSYLQKRHIHREGYRLHPFSSSCFTSSKTAFSPRGLPAPPLFTLFFQIFKNGIFTERVTGSTPFHPVVSHLQKRHFHREAYQLHPFSSSCFTSSKTAFSPRGLPAPPLFILFFTSSKTAVSPRGLPAPPLFILLLHIFKNGIFTERVTGSTPFHPLVSHLQKWHFHQEGYRLHPFYPLVSHLQKRHFHREGYRLHPFSSSFITSSKTAFSPRGLPAPPLFILLFHIFKNGIFTERVTGSSPFHPLASYLQKRHFHREGYRLHPFSSFCFISSKTAFSPRGLPAPPLFTLLLHIFKNGIFTERVTGSTPFHPLVSHLQKRHFHREGYRLHPFSSSCFTSSKTAFSPRGLPAPPLFILLFHIFKNGIFTERVTGSIRFPPLVSHLQKRHLHRKGYRLHPFSSSCFTSSKVAFSPRGLPAPPLFILCSYLQKRHFHREGYRLHPFSSSCFISSKTAFSPRGLPAPPLFILLLHISKNGIFTKRVTGSTPFILLFHIFKNGIFTERVTGPTPFPPLFITSSKTAYSPRGLPAPPLSLPLVFTSSKTAFSPRGLPAPPLFILLFHIFKNGIFTERVTGSTPFPPLVSHLQKRHFHREGYRLHPFSSSCFISSKTAFSPKGLAAPPLFILLFHIFKNGIFTERVTSSTPFPPLASYLQKTAYSPRGLPAPPLFILLFHIFKNGIFTERGTGSTPFHPLVSHLQKRHFHREGYRLHPFSSSCFISSKTAFSPRGLPAPPLFILLLHIFKNGIFTERVTGSTPFHPLVSHLQKRHFHREGYRLHPFSSSCFTSSKTTFSPRGLPAPPLFIPLFHIFKNGIFTEKVTGSTPFPPLVSHLQKRHFHREGYRLHPFSSSFFISSKTAFSPRGLPAPPLFILLFHIFKNGIFTERVTGSTRFPPLVSHLQKRHFHREGYRLHPFSSSCFISSKTAFSPRGLPAPPLFILLFHIFKKGIFTERVTGSTPFHPLVSHLPKTAFSPRGLPAPPLFILLLHIFKNGIFTERVTGSTPFHPLVSHLQKGHFHREGYRLHPFSSSCFTSSKTAFYGIFTERVTGSTTFHPLVSHLQQRHFHRKGYRLHPFSSSCFISSKTTFSPRGLPAPPFFILLFHIFKNGIFTERVTGSTPFHPLVSHLQKRHIHREGYRLHPFSSSCFTSSKTAFSPRGLPALPLFILLFHIFKNGIFTERVTGPTPFHPLVSHLQKRHFHREGYPLHPFSSYFFIFSKTAYSPRGLCFISSKTAFSPRGLPAPPLFIFLFHIFKNGIFTERVTGSTPFHPLSYLQKRHFHREGYRLHPFSSSCFISSKTAFSPRGLPAPPLFILLFHIFKNGIFTERVTGSTPLHPLVSHLQKRHFHREGYRLHPFSSSCFTSSKTAFSPRGLPAPPLFLLLFHIFKNGISSRLTIPQ